MLGGFAGFGLDEEPALETLGAGVVAAEGEEAGEVFALALHVGVEEGEVAFAAAPEHVAFAAEGECGVDGALELAGGAGEDGELGVGASAVHVTRIAEEVGGAPEEFYAGGGLLLLQIGDDGGHAGLELGEGGAGFVNDVGVVEAIVGRAELGDELEGGVGLVLGAPDRIGGVEPGHGAGGRSEGVGAVAAEAVPVGDGVAEPLGKGAAHDDAGGVVMAEGERIGALRAFVGDGVDVR